MLTACWQYAWLTVEENKSGNLSSFPATHLLTCHRYIEDMQHALRHLCEDSDEQETARRHPDGEIR